MIGFLKRWRQSWQRQPKTCLVFGVVCLGYVIVPVGIGGLILVVSVWFAPDLLAAPAIHLVGIAGLYTLLPWFGLRLAGWLNWQRLRWRSRLGLA